MYMKRVKLKLEKSELFFSIFAILVAFLTYSSMYAFRKPFSAAMFDNLVFLGVHYKIWLITSQVIGYTISKFIGIKLVSEMKPQMRAVSIITVIGIAWLALLLFAITPTPVNIIWMFFNGLPLGMVWGFVFSYLEGRRVTELLGAGISITFILSSGFVKAVGKYLILEYNISEFWMPFFTGSLFVIPLLVSVWLLNQLPFPNQKDIEQRTLRVPMSSSERMAFLKKFIGLVVPITLTYIFLTIIRDVRDNFAAEIWEELEQGDSSSIFVTAEIPVAISVLFAISLMFLIKNNLKALITSVFLVIFGLAVNILATLAFNAHLIGGVTWMILVGFGLYLGYITYHAFLFERFIAAFRYVSNVGFIFYIADAFGYLGSISTFLLKNFFSPNLEWTGFFGTLTYVLSILGILLCIITYLAVIKKHKKLFPLEYIKPHDKN